MRRCSRFLPGAIIITICALGICSVARAEDGDDRPLWNVAWITDTQTPECEWITTLLARLMANKPKIVIHTGDTRFEWANRCAWKDGDHHQYCYEQRDGITYITATGIYPGHYGDCDAMTLWVYKDHLRLDQYVIGKGLPMKTVHGPTTIWTCEGKFHEYQRPEFPEKPAQPTGQLKKFGTIGPNLIKNGDFENGIWYERF